MHTRRAVKMKSCIGETAYTASKTVSVHPMHRYSPYGDKVNISRVRLNLKHPDVRLFTFYGRIVTMRVDTTTHDLTHFPSADFHEIFARTRGSVSC